MKRHFLKFFFAALMMWQPAFAADFSAYPSVTTLAPTDIMLWKASGVTSKITEADLATVLGVGGGCTNNCTFTGTFTVPAGSLQYSYLQNVTANRLLGNPTGSAAAPSEISLGTGLSFSSSTLNYVTPNSAITYAKIQNETNATLLGNFSGGVAAPSEYTLGAGLNVVGGALNTKSLITYVAPATGTEATDEASINAAFVTAAGGEVDLPTGQTYIVGAKGIGATGAPSSGAVTILPSVFDCHGSTIKRTATVVSTTTSTVVGAGTTSITVAAGHGADFAVGDLIVVRDSAGTFTYPLKILTDSSDTITFASISNMGNGTTTSGTATVQRFDPVLQYNVANSPKPLIIKNCILDGNSTVRLAASPAAIQAWTSNMIFDDSAGGNAIVFDHDTFQNSEADGIQINNDSYTKVADSHFTNIWGQGIHPGGNGTMKDYIVANNTFSNIYQFTNATTTTATQFGHTSPRGAIGSSTGPQHVVIIGNVVDTSTAWCVNGVDSFSADWVISGNNLSNCKAGAFQVTNGKNTVITGNEMYNNGQDVAYVTGQHEVTQLSTATNQMATISGNLFVNTPFNVFNGSSKISVNGNTFDTTGNGSTILTRGSHDIYAALAISGSGTSDTLSISGNTFNGPTAAGTSYLDDILLTTVTNVAITGNSIIGGQTGINFQGSVNNVTISGNTLQDQMNNNSGFPYASAIGFTGASSNITNLNVVDNSMMLSGNTGSYGWLGINLGSPQTFLNSQFSNNIFNIGFKLTSRSGAISDRSTNTGAGLTIQNNQITGVNTTFAFETGNFTSACNVIGNRIVAVSGSVSTNVGAATLGAGPSSVYTGTATGTVLTVSGMTSGALSIGQTIYGMLPAGTKIVSYGTGLGGTGTYNLNATYSSGTPAGSQLDSNFYQ